MRKEDAKSIIDQHLLAWYHSARMGVEKADVSGADETFMWFTVAGLGNMLWAGTAFVAPEATFAIKAMSVIGAAIGSGTIATAKQCLAQKNPADHLKQLIVRSLSERYARMQKDRALTDRMNDMFQRSGVASDSDTNQTHDRRELAWKLMFKGTVPYDDLAAIEDQTRANVEAIWAKFKDAYASRFPWGTFTPEAMIESDVPVLFARALHDSGVEAQMLDPKPAGSAADDPYSQLKPLPINPYAFRRAPIWLRGPF